MELKENVLSAWPITSESQQAMQDAIASHMAADNLSRPTSQFSKWFHNSLNANRAMQRLPQGFPASALIDLCAAAIRRYMNFDPARDVETDGQAEDWRKTSQAFEAAVIARDIKHPDPTTDMYGRKYLSFFSNRPRDPKRLQKNHAKAARQLFIRTLASAIHDRFGKVDSHVVWELTSIVDATIDHNQVRREINRIISSEAPSKLDNDTFVSGMTTSDINFERAVDLMCRWELADSIGRQNFFCQIKTVSAEPLITDVFTQLAQYCSRFPTATVSYFRQ